MYHNYQTQLAIAFGVLGGLALQPATFIKFNRAIRARVAAYQKDYTTAVTALAASFINDTAATIDFKAGVNYAYSLAAGDASNGLINTAAATTTARCPAMSRVRPGGSERKAPPVVSPRVP